MTKYYIPVKLRIIYYLQSVWFRYYLGSDIEAFNLYYLELNGPDRLTVPKKDVAMIVLNH